MSIFLDQIEKRKRLEEATLIETFEKATKRLGINGGSHRHKPKPTDNTALRQVIDALGVTGYELTNDGISTPQEQLATILEPRGIMMRKVKLTEGWWKVTIGPMLGYDKDGGLTALLPTRWGFGYTFTDKDGHTVSVNKTTANTLSRHAVCFCKQLCV